MKMIRKLAPKLLVAVLFGFSTSVFALPTVSFMGKENSSIRQMIIQSCDVDQGVFVDVPIEGMLLLCVEDYESCITIAPGELKRLNAKYNKAYDYKLLSTTSCSKVTEDNSPKDAEKHGELELSRAGKKKFQSGNYQAAIEYLEKARAAEFSGVWQSSYPYLAASYWIIGEKEKARASILALSKELNKPSGYLSSGNDTTRGFVKSALKEAKRAIPNSDRSSWDNLISEHLGAFF